MNGKVTYHQQVSYCGKPRCRKCREGTGHGPYWYRYQTIDGRTTRTYIGKHLPPEIQETMEGYHEPPSSHADEREQSTIRIYTLGQFRLERRSGRDASEWQTVTDSAWQHQRVRSLLCCLVSSSGRKLGREQIMDTLWPDLDIDAAASRLDRAVYSLRQIFEPSRGRLATSPLLLTEREMIVLAEHPQVWIDGDVFDQLLAQAHATSDPGEKERLLEEAATLYGGDFLPEERKLEATLARRDSLRRSWIGLLLDLADLRIAREALNSAIDPLDRLMSVDPTNEAAVQRLISLLAQLGRRGEALRAYKRLATVLQQEYRIAPLPETRALYEAVRSGADKLPTQRSSISESSGATAAVTRSDAASSPAPSPTIQIGRSHQSPLVGREEEIGLLRVLVTETERTAKFKLAAQKKTSLSSLDTQRRPQSVLLMGDVGIGKTRLAEEISRDAKKLGWAVAWSRVYAQEGSIPYRLWTEVLRKAMTQGAWQRQEVSRRPLVFQPLAALLPELHELLPQVALSSSLPPEQEQLRLWEAARELLTIISDSTSLLIALDDLQWADGSSCELLAYLARRLQNHPIVIVGTCRENELGASHPLRPLLTDLQRENAVETIQLQPLSDEQISMLVSQVSQVAEPVMQRISTRAAGNPFFAEELARSIGTQVLLSTDSDTALPDTITAVLDLRLSRLSPACHRLLNKAAVLGGSFEFHIINEMEASTPGSSEDIVLDLLEEALRSGMLTEEGTGTRITYHFWHPLLVNHLYEGLSAARRASLHRRAAEIFRQVYRDREEEGAATITHHLVRGGADSQQIVHYAELAGNRAYAFSSYLDAEKFYRITLEHLEYAVGKSTANTSSKEQLHFAYLLECLGECTRIQGKYEEARRFYEQALDVRSWRHILADVDNPQWEAQIRALLWYEIARTWYDTGDTVKSRKYCGRGEQVLRDADVKSGLAWAKLRFQQSYIDWREGKYEEAQFAAQEALSLFEETLEGQKHAIENSSHPIGVGHILVGDPIDLGRAHTLLGMIANGAGQCSDALFHLNAALTLYEQHDSRREIAIVSCDLGDVHMRKAEYSLAQALFRRSLNIAEKIGDIPSVSIDYGNLGVLAMRSGNLDEAEDWFKRGIALAERINNPVYVCVLHTYLAIVLYEQDKIIEARTSLCRSLVLSRTLQIAPCIGLALVALGHTRINQAMLISANGENGAHEGEEFSRTLKRAKGALQLALSLEGMEAETRTEAQLQLAFVMSLLDDIDIALELALRTFEEARQFELTWLAACAQRVLGCILALRDQEQSSSYFERALQVFRKHGMRLEYAHTLRQYGQVLMQRGAVGEKEYQRAIHCLQEAHQIFTSCKASLDVKMTERILARYE